jgi:AcrR family transcriptional regulator
LPRKRQSTKSRIIKAAWNLFYKKGYDQTTIEDIIVASKTSKGTFYHYFKGKEGNYYVTKIALSGNYETFLITEENQQQLLQYSDEFKKFLEEYKQ